MASRSEAVQLFDLCAFQGATPARIAQHAPFLRDLPATQHALDVLVAGGGLDWTHAARELLDCVTKPRGAGGLDERRSRFARACLALDDSHEALGSRLMSLVNDPDYKFPRSPATQQEEREAVMGILATKLLALERYPCAPGAERLKLAVLFGIMVRAPEFFSQEAEVQSAQLADVFEQIPGAVSVFEQHDPSLSLAERLRITVRAIAVRSYRDIYEELLPRSAEFLVSPELVPRLFEDIPFPIGRDAPVIDRTMEIFARIVENIEVRGAWESVLLAATAEEEPFALTAVQALRLRAYFERLTDQDSDK